MQQLSLYEIICICSSIGYIVSDTLLNKLNFKLSKTVCSLYAMIGGDIGVWIISDPYILNDIQWLIASISSFLSVYIIESFIAFKKKTTILSEDGKKLDEILTIIRKLEK